MTVERLSRNITQNEIGNSCLRAEQNDRKRSLNNIRDHTLAFHSYDQLEHLLMVNPRCHNISPHNMVQQIRKRAQTQTVPRAS